MSDPIYLPDERGVKASRFGRGNRKLGDVYTYSRLPGRPCRPPLGSDRPTLSVGTCPGATPECLSICYAARVVAEDGMVAQVWTDNSGDAVPANLPYDCTLFRLHVSGDFDTENYILGWHDVLAHHDRVTAWAYTRSWRVPELLPALEKLRALPNVQLFASMDASTVELPPVGWRRAWIDGDARADTRGVPETRNRHTFDNQRTLVCPEQTGHKPTCQACRYCFDGRRGDVTFLQH